MSNSSLVSLHFTYLIISSLSFILVCKADAPKETGEQMQFSYTEGTPFGPKNWGRLSHEWKTCGDGKFQSPINIDVKRCRVKPSDFKRSNYMDASATLVIGYDNIAVEWVGDAGRIEVNGSTYKLVQCHWHTPSEHTINGKKFDAELHLVHKNDNGQKAVIGVLQTVGEPDPFFGSLTTLISHNFINNNSYTHLTEKIKAVSYTNDSAMHLGKLSGSSIRCGSKRYYRYMGSFTTPPCKEGVIWTIAEKIRSISKDQLKLLKDLHQHEFRENARPLQQLVGRQVWQFDLPREKE